MAPTSTLSSKGQITVPLEIRQRLGLKPGDRVEFVVEDGKTVLRPNRNDEENPFLKYVGVFPYFQSREEVNAWVRDMRDEETDPADAELLRKAAEREKDKAGR